MLYFFLVVVVFVLLILVLGVCVVIGRRFGRVRMDKHVEHKLEILGVAESAVFGLLALLIAFTFSGAYERFETRKMHILEEANIFDTAYEYIALVPTKYQATLHENVPKYLDLLVATYADIPDVDKVDADLDKAINVQHSIWETVLIAAKENPADPMIQFYLPAMNDMFEIFHAGINMTKIHPPAIIFVLLIGLAALGAFLVGYNAAESKQKHPIHILCYVLLTAFTIYVIINLEYPRMGFIQLNDFEQMLLDVREDMNHPY